MRRLALFLSCCLAAASAGGAPGARSAVAADVAEDQFHSLTGTGFWLVKFYAPWCGHCKHLAPVLDEASLAVQGSGLRIATVDCTVQTGLASKYDIQGYPTLKVFRDGVVSDYDGRRSAEGIKVRHSSAAAARGAPAGATHPPPSAPPPRSRRLR